MKMGHLKRLSYLRRNNSEKMSQLCDFFFTINTHLSSCRSDTFCLKETFITGWADLTKQPQAQFQGSGELR